MNIYKDQNRGTDDFIYRPEDPALKGLSTTQRLARKLQAQKDEIYVVEDHIITDSDCREIADNISELILKFGALGWFQAMTMRWETSVSKAYLIDGACHKRLCECINRALQDPRFRDHDADPPEKGWVFSGLPFSDDGSDNWTLNAWIPPDLDPRKAPGVHWPRFGAKNTIEECYALLSAFHDFWLRDRTSVSDWYRYCQYYDDPFHIQILQGSMRPLTLTELEAFGGVIRSVTADLRETRREQGNGVRSHSVTDGLHGLLSFLDKESPPQLSFFDRSLLEEYCKQLASMIDSLTLMVEGIREQGYSTDEFDKALASVQEKYDRNANILQSSAKSQKKSDEPVCLEVSSDNAASTKPTLPSDLISVIEIRGIVSQRT